MKWWGRWDIHGPFSAPVVTVWFAAWFTVSEVLSLLWVVPWRATQRARRSWLARMVLYHALAVELMETRPNECRSGVESG